MSVRETAWRMFSAEILACSVEEKGSGERPTTYLISPAGARASRVLIAGSLRALPPDRAESPDGVRRFALTDRTGSVPVTAGPYQPRAVAALRDWTDERPAVVVGKVHRFGGREGSPPPSVRAESVAALTAEALADLTAEIAEQTEARIALVDELRRHTALPETDLRRAPRLWLEAARRAMPEYRTAELERLRESLRREAGAGSEPVHDPAPVARPGATPVPRAPAPRSPSPPSPAERAQESAFLDIVDELADASADGCAEVREVLQRTAGEGVPRVVAEALIHRLEAGGVLEEPSAGRLRRPGPEPAS